VVKRCIIYRVSITYYLPEYQNRIKKCLFLFKRELFKVIWVFTDFVFTL